MTQIQDNELADHMDVYYKRAMRGGMHVRQVEDYYLTDESEQAMASGQPEPKHYQRVPTGVNDYYKPMGESSHGNNKDVKLLKNFVASVENNNLPPVEEPVLKKKEEQKKKQKTEQPPDEEKEEDVTQNGEDEFEVRNGYLIYPVKFSDTIEGVSIRFDVSKDAIRMANNFYGEDIWMKKELRIPYAKGMKYRKKEPTKIKELEQQFAIELVTDIMATKYKMKNCAAEARYYLDLNGFNTELALQELENDLKFEAEVADAQKLFVKKK